MNPKNRIKEYLDKMAENDELFAKTYAKENKNLDECLNFIMSEAQKKGGNAVCMTDEEVFGLAVHYYDEDDIKIKPMPNARVKISTSTEKIELTEEEKAIAKERAINQLKDEELAKLKKSEELKRHKAMSKAEKEAEFEKKQLSLF